MSLIWRSEESLTDLSRKEDRIDNTAQESELIIVCEVGWRRWRWRIKGGGGQAPIEDDPTRGYKRKKKTQPGIYRGGVDTGRNSEETEST